MHRPLTAALASALTLVCVPALADVAPRPEDTILQACFVAFVPGVLVVVIWVLYRVRRRRR